MPAAMRLGDLAMVQGDAHGGPCCGYHPVSVGPAVQGSTNVNINSMPAIRLNDIGIHAVCCGQNMWTATAGSGTVNINSKKAIRMQDETTHCGAKGQVIQGSPNVIVGG